MQPTKIMWIASNVHIHDIILVMVGFGSEFSRLKSWFDRLSSEAAFQDATKTLFPKVEALLKVLVLVYALFEHICPHVYIFS